MLFSLFSWCNTEDIYVLTRENLRKMADGQDWEISGLWHASITSALVVLDCNPNPEGASFVAFKFTFIMPVDVK